MIGRVKKKKGKLREKEREEGELSKKETSKGGKGIRGRMRQH